MPVKPPTAKNQGCVLQDHAAEMAQHNELKAVRLDARDTIGALATGRPWVGDHRELHLRAPIDISPQPSSASSLAVREPRWNGFSRKPAISSSAKRSVTSCSL